MKKKLKEDSKADKARDKKLGIKEGSKRDRPVGSVQNVKANQDTAEKRLQRGMRGGK